MATPAEFGKNKHNALLGEAQATVARLTGTLAEIVEELDGQRRQARPRMDTLAILTARAVKQTVSAGNLLAEMQEIVAGMRATRSEVAELQDQIETLRAVVAGLAERRG